MANETIQRITVSMKLEDEDGKKYSATLGTIDPTTYDDDKAYAIVQAIEPVLLYDLVGIEVTKKYVLEGE